MCVYECIYVSMCVVWGVCRYVFVGESVDVWLVYVL